MFLGAAILLLFGWDALSSGALSVSRKGHTSILLTPTGSPWSFYIEVWVRLIAGGLLFACSVGLPIFLVFLSPQRRAERLRRASLERVRHGGPNISLRILALVILGIFAFIYIWMRHVT
jgi:hypothetical protein